MNIPTIDFANYDPDQFESLKALATPVYQALADSGFMTVTNIGIETGELDRMFAVSGAFFAQPDAIKNASAYTSSEDNFGYQAFGSEHLDPNRPVDIKESFNMRSALNRDSNESRWPSPVFRDNVIDFYQRCFNASERLHRVIAVALGLPQDYFLPLHSGENITLRLLHYPRVANEVISQGQLGCGAHTDYGSITLLFQHGVSGLEVESGDGNWHPVSCQPGAIVINTGDLMERWSNGLFRSTTHRVKPMTGDTDRYSIAYFVDPDSAVTVTPLASCVSAQRPSIYPPVNAGEHIYGKLKATH